MSQPEKRDRYDTYGADLGRNQRPSYDNDSDTDEEADDEYFRDLFEHFFGHGFFRFSAGGGTFYGFRSSGGGGGGRGFGGSQNYSSRYQQSYKADFKTKETMERERNVKSTFTTKVE